jgi:hypothetical protein
MEIATCAQHSSCDESEATIVSDIGLRTEVISMKELFGSWIVLLSLTSILKATPPAVQETKYKFATRDYLIEMRVAFFAPYRGRRLAFFESLDPRKELCYSAAGRARACIEQFVGALAVVNYEVKPANSSRLPRSASIRECVTTSAQSAGLPASAPFSMRQRLVDGIGSDIQVFGYDQASLKKAARIRIRSEAQATWWRLCKQELYMDQETKPFAIVEWKHALDRISITRVYGATQLVLKNGEKSAEGNRLSRSDVSAELALVQ